MASFSAVFEYESSWERSKNSTEASEILSGERFQLTNFELSPSYFAHRFQKPADYQVFVTRLFTFITFHEINDSGDLTLFWKVAKSVAAETVKIHPNWNQRLTDIVRLFDIETCVPFVQEMEAKRSH